MIAVRPMEEGDRLPLAEIFAEAALEGTGIATEGTVDLDERAASWIMDGTLVAVAQGRPVGSISCPACSRTTRPASRCTASSASSRRGAG